MPTNDSIPTLDYAGDIARSGVRMQQDDTGLTISMPPPRWKYLSATKKFIFLFGGFFFLVGLTVEWLYALMFVAFSVMVIMRFTRRVRFRVDAKLFSVGIRRWSIERVLSVKRVPENLGLAIAIRGGESFDVDCGNEQQVLEWVAAKLNDAIAARQAKPDAVPGGAGDM